MSKTKFIYEIEGDKKKRDKMRALLKEIGGKNYWRAIADCGEIYMEQKPIGVDGHYLEFECETEDIFLYYSYGGGTVIKILQMNGFWAIPTEGWEKVTTYPNSR